ncbi:hypothetical protein LK994_04355 [Ferruginibacter lapsinanis]|uniref:hypothetical protein n=1 Tax=Ferruginibacter lapsinanis TaxID=563172 RepID=UPI001E4FFE2E|nr:hypothetical protein [Ferruginibacter lapsinanis]UEG50704.1 hypothetical protein LK994_04355 [Ferruginibacter lapsinanis]
MHQYVQKYFCVAFFLLIANICAAQLTVSGTVYDSTKIIPVKDVIVQSSSGRTAITDSAGHYEIVTDDADSLTFIYNNKPSLKFSVRQIENISSFDISLRIRTYEKYKSLREVKVFSKTYKQDSIENRERYAKIFNHTKPGISTTTSTYSGVPGMDLDEFINIFRFKRNRQLRNMQNRLLEQEQENYINYRFNKMMVKRITHLDGKELDTFMQKYRPDYAFTIASSTVDFYQYILNSSYQFKRDLLLNK